MFHFRRDENRRAPRYNNDNGGGDDDVMTFNSQLQYSLHRLVNENCF